MGKEVNNIKRQSGKKTNIFYDERIMAMYPGKRVSNSGKTYWETRKNRTDIDKKKRL